MDRLSWREFEQSSKTFFESELGISLREHMPVPLLSGENHKFDLVSADETVAIECKSHTWTRSGNYPSAKSTDAKNSIDFLKKSRARRKIIVFQDDSCPKGSLVEVFVRRNRNLLSGIEAWRFLEGRFEKFADYSDESLVSVDRGASCLEIVFDGAAKPYFEEQPKAVLPAGTQLDRRYRVGIRNTSGTIVLEARLVLENCTPDEPHGVHLGHSLQVMGKPAGTAEFSVYPGEIPSTFVDVVYDEIVDGRLQGNAFGLCYAAPVTTHAIPRGSYVLTLKVEGHGAQNRKKFAVGQEAATGMLMMRELQS